MGVLSTYSVDSDGRRRRNSSPKMQRHRDDYLSPLIGPLDGFGLLCPRFTEGDS